MSIHSYQNMISLEKSRISMWEKYRHESKQTICIIGVLTLATKLCKADGHFSEIEEEAIAQQKCKFIQPIHSPFIHTDHSSYGE